MPSKQRISAMLCALLVWGCAQSVARADDWPQWRGASRNGISSESAWLSTWSAAPRKAWQAFVGEGYSSVAVARGKVYTVGNANGKDTIFGLDVNNGKVAWQYSYPCESGDYSGPRATPTVDGDKVYTLSRDGRAFCLNADSGKIVWQANLAQQANAPIPTWGFAGSPLIEGGNVIYNVSSMGVAADKNSGRIVWKSPSGDAGYSSPLSFAAGGQRGVALFTGWGIVAVNPANGRKLWGHPWDTSYKVNAADPIFSGDNVFISSNYERGCALLKVGAGNPAVVYENKNMRNHFNTCVLVDGYLYGNDQNNLKCIELRSGRVMWRMGGMGKGGLIAADKKIIALTERGELFVLAANPNKYTELAHAKVIDGECWTHPVLAGGRIFCRSHQGNLVCLDVRKR